MQQLPPNSPCPWTPTPCPVTGTREILGTGEIVGPGNYVYEPAGTIDTD